MGLQQGQLGVVIGAGEEGVEDGCCDEGLGGAGPTSAAAACCVMWKRRREASLRVSYRFAPVMREIMCGF